MKAILTIATVLLAFCTSDAIAADDATENLLKHHIASFLDNDLEAVMSDYASDSVLMTKDVTYRGPTEIRAFFSSLIPHFPRQKPGFDLDRMVVNDDGLALIVWHARTPTVDVPFATDTFVVKGGKIHRQTFSGQMTIIAK